jgi:intracellular sulfur oxidation DsrE/DsrF family protein
MKLRLWVLVAASAASLSLGATAGHAAAALGQPVIPEYGKISPIENPQERPDPNLDYKVVVNVTKAGEKGAPPPELEKAAKVANLLAVYGVPANHRHIVAIIQGSATGAVMSAAAMQARGLGANPTIDLVAKLNAAGVRVDVCSQALAVAKITPAEVMSGIQVDLSALTTLTTLELKGYALLSD